MVAMAVEYIRVQFDTVPSPPALGSVNPMGENAHDEKLTVGHQRS